VTKRIRESVTVTAAAACGPTAFTWRGSTYRVVAVLGHWREDAAYWAGAGVEVPQRDLWRVEARNGTPLTGVFELVAEGGAWRLDRVWD
jgi:hypothetical protein